MTREAPPLHYGFATREDGAACNAINNDVYKRNRTLAQWEWEFTPPHLPFDEIPYALARDGEAIVGTQGYIMVPMISEKGIFWTAKGEDAVVLFRYWSRNVLPSLWETLIGFCERNHITIVWGFNARKGSFSRVGLQYFEEPLASDLIRPLGTGAMDAVLKDTNKMRKAFERRGGGAAKTAISIGASLLGDGRMLFSRVPVLLGGDRGVSIERLSGPPREEFDFLSKRFIAIYGGMTIHRSAAYLKWRLHDNPFVTSTILTARRHGELCGYAAFAIAHDGQAYISDQMVCAPGASPDQNRAIAEALLVQIVSSARAAGATVIRLHAFNGHPADRLFHAAARRVGFLARGREVGACYRPVPGAGPLPDATPDYDKWYVTGANHEGRHG
jgi:hypothetical protein